MRRPPPEFLDTLVFLRLKGGNLRLKKEEKEKQVAWLRDQFRTTKALFLGDFRSLTVSEMNKLRSELRDRGIAFKVLKNTLVRRAYQDTDVAAIGPDLAGPRAAAWTSSEENVPAMAKVLVDFAKTHPNLVLVRGVLNGKLVDPSEMDTLSKLPSREELLGRVLGTMMAPVSAFVNTLAAIPRSFLNVLKAIEEQKSTPSEPAAG
jgi:large subunit ribosomal protein L10